MKRFQLILLASCWCAFALGVGVLAQPQGRYHLLRKVPLGAAEGGGEYFDYLTFDAAARRVYMSHGTEIEVLNADNDQPVGKITGLNGTTELLLFPNWAADSSATGTPAKS